MPYDPTLPATGAPIVSAELRNQFAGLKDLIDDKASSADVSAAITSETPKNIDGMDTLSLIISNPPTQGEVQQIADKIAELISALQRT
jgi:hypothetical protein